MFSQTWTNQRIGKILRGGGGAPCTEVVSFSVSLSTASCGVGVEYLYAENKFMCALYCFHEFTIVWRLLQLQVLTGVNLGL